MNCCDGVVDDVLYGWRWSRDWRLSISVSAVMYSAYVVDSGSLLVFFCNGLAPACSCDISLNLDIWENECRCCVGWMRH